MEIAFWQGFVVLTGVAAIFVLWPTLYVRKDKKIELRTDARTQANEDVFIEQLKELESTHAHGEINAAELEDLRNDLAQTHSAELQASQLDTDKPIVTNLRSRLPVIGLVLAIPLFTLLFYMLVGAKPDWDIYQLAVERGIATDPKERAEVNQTLIAELQNRLSSKPENVQNWYLLANVAQEAGDFDESVRAYRRILQIQPKAAVVLAELAQSLFLRAGNTITPEVRDYTKKALEMNAFLPTALGLAGIDAFQSGQYQAAIDSWQKALSQLNPKSSASQVLSDGITRAKLALEQSGGGKSQKKTEEKGKNISINVSVALDKKSVTDVAPEDIVFIYARAWQGPKMPLAIQRMTVAELPAKITLDQSMSMAPGMDLTSFPQVEVIARISQSGSAIPQSGDWQKSSGPIILAENKGIVKVVIDERVP